MLAWKSILGIKKKSNYEILTDHFPYPLSTSKKPKFIPICKEIHATTKLTDQQLTNAGLSKKRSTWKPEDWSNFRQTKGWEEGSLKDYPVNLETAFPEAGMSQEIRNKFKLHKFTSCFEILSFNNNDNNSYFLHNSGVKPNKFSSNPTALEIFKYFMDPLYPELLRCSKFAINESLGKYSQYTSKRSQPEVTDDLLNRFFAAQVEIRLQHKKTYNLSKWWAHPTNGGNAFIQSCLSRHEFKLVKHSVLDGCTTPLVEHWMSEIKKLTQEAFQMPLFVIVDECMVKARIHHLVSLIII